MTILFNLAGGTAIAAGALGTLVILVFILAGGANSKPEEAAMLRMWLIASAAGGLACFAGGIALLSMHKPGFAALVGAAPMLFVVGCMIYLTMKQA